MAPMRPAEEPRPRRTPPELAAESAAMRRLLAALERLTDVDDPVLLEGETGTGKGLLARTLHALGPRAAGRFVAVNCGALAPGLLEAELFGTVRGAYTGADADRPGLFEAADRGTLFLDGLEAMPEAMQRALLRALDERKVRRVGAVEEVAVDVRILGATNEPLRDRVARGLFRKDLYYRLNAFALRVPPLRERPEDLPLLAGRFLREQAQELRRAPRELSPEALERLRGYAWPGNVRELRNEMRRLAALGEGAIREEELAPAIRNAGSGGGSPSLRSPFRERVREFERQLILEALREHRGNLSAAARALGMGRATLRRKLRTHSLENPENVTGK